MSNLVEKQKPNLKFDKVSRLIGELDVVWQGEMCGIFDNFAQELILPIEYTEISLSYPPFCKVRKGEKRGLFDVYDRRVEWILKS